MAVVITINDKDKKLTMDVEFNPPLTDECSDAQVMALRMINFLGGHRVQADRHRLTVVHYPVPDQMRNAPACGHHPD